MDLRPPVLRDLNACSAEFSDNPAGPREVWEISVSMRLSLYSSSILSVLFLDEQESVTDRIKRIIGEDSGEIIEKNAFKIDSKKVKYFIGTFNPFMMNKKERLRRNRVLNYLIQNFRKRIVKSKQASKDVPNNDDSSLTFAAKLLRCRIDVYHSSSTESGDFITYGENFETRIYLFRYIKSQDHESSGRGPIYRYTFGLPHQAAHKLQLDALEYTLQTAKIINSDKLLQLAKNSVAHGTSFLPTLIDSDCHEILPQIYKFPTTACMLSHAGYETDPIAVCNEKPSALSYALHARKPKYFKILYDYASNCGFLFKTSVRRADEYVLENLKRIRRIIESDLSKVETFFQNHKEVSHVLSQLKPFADYQIKMASDLFHLKNAPRDNTFSSELKLCKDTIQLILENYLSFYHYKSDIENNQINYLTFCDYYKYTDNFSFLSFFDHFYKLRLCVGLEQESLVLKIEQSMLITIFTYNYFNETAYSNLRYISFFFRNSLENEIKHFLEKLKSDYKDKDVFVNSELIPQVADEIVITRLVKYMNAMLQVSPKNDGLKAVLVIERALQVIGESLKPPSNKDSSVSFLLNFCLPLNLQKKLICIRNDLSKYRSNSVYGRLIIEKNYNIFECIRRELCKIKEDFDTVVFTQQSKMRESLLDIFDKANEGIERADLAISNELREIFKKDITQSYEIYRKRCAKLLFQSFAHLQENLKNNKLNNENQFKSIYQLIKIIRSYKHENFLDELLHDVSNMYILNRSIYHNDNDQHCFQDLEEQIIKCQNKILKYNPVAKVDVLSAPYIETFLDSLKIGSFSNDDKIDLSVAFKNALHEATDAKEQLKILSEKSESISVEIIDELLKKILVPYDKLSEIREYFINKSSSSAKKHLNKTWISEETISEDVERMFNEDSIRNDYTYTLITKVAFQRRLKSKFYSSAKLSKRTSLKLEDFLLKKINFLKTRLVFLKEKLLLGNERDILKCYFRELYKIDDTVCASLEMAFFDIMNAICKKSNESQELCTEDHLRKLHEKSCDLYAGINMRNLIAHRLNIPETIGSFLDEDDFPSEMIDKVFKLIDDSEGIDAMLKFFKVGGIFTENDFIAAVENNNFKEFTHSKMMMMMMMVKAIKKCPRWKEYLFLFPFFRI